MNLYFIFILLLLSIEDFMHLEISVFLLILLFLSIFIKKFIFFNFIAFFFISLFLYFLNNKHNFADLAIISICATQFDFYYCGLFLFLIGFLSLFYGLITKKDKTPMVPCILMSYFFIYFVNLYLF